MFPRPERLTPEMARPDQFHRLPGVMWHGNYDPSEVTRADGQLGRDNYNSVGVHAGTRRAAMDALDMHGGYDPHKDANWGANEPPNRNLDEVQRAAWDDQEARREITRRGGQHGFLHPVLPSRIRPGLRPDAGENWSRVALENNPPLRREVSEWPHGEPVHPDEIRLGLRYKNESEHPDTHSVLIPNTASMQHSDYVREAVLNGKKVHPLTQRLYDEGVLDAAEARRYDPMDASSVGYNVAHSDTKRKVRTSRIRASRKRNFLRSTIAQPELPFGES